MNRTARSLDRSRGIVLPLSLVMLVMITLLAVVAIRGVTTEERIAANLRSSSVGFEMAELALRYCEEIAWAGQDPTGTVKLNDIKFVEAPVTGAAWSPPKPSNANWSDPVKAPVPPSSQLPTGVAAPRCMVEEALGWDPYIPSYRPELRPKVYIVSAQGYGDSTTTNFRATVQSQLRPPNPFAAAR